jgi:hypothetical protein
MYGNRGIYHDGWIACSQHRIPWEATAKAGPLDDDGVGALRHQRQLDPVPAARLWPERQPAKLQELQRLFMLEASKYNVFPLDDRLAERFNSELAGRPEPVKG